jgi:multiple sugar transport system substrate-binding protein
MPKRIFFRSLFVFILFSISFLISSESDVLKRIALVIGNSSYKANGLKNPANDAHDISGKLEKLGFEVVKVINANKQQMKEAIRNFGDRLSKNPDTLGLFFYAGHGCQVKGINYLLPVDADIKGEDEVEFNAIDVGFVLAKMETAGNRINILILDACRDNPFRSFRSASRGLTVVEAPKSSLIVYATAPGSVAADGKGRNGVFTGALLKNLDKNPDMDIELFIRNVRKDVMVETGNDQVPWTSSSLTESISFKGVSKEPKEAVVESTTSRVETSKEKELQGTLSIWNFNDDFKKLGFIERFEKKYPKVKINLTVLPYNDYLSKITALLRSGKDTPDIFSAEYAFIIDLVESGYWDDLSQAPYNADVSDLFIYLIDAGTDSTGALRAISNGASPGGIFYRRSLAKRYLGTDDPAEVGNMLDTEEKFLAVARELSEKSGGKVKMIGAYNDYIPYPLCRRTKSFVSRNNRLNIEQCIIDYFDFAKTLHNENLTAKAFPWSGEWFEEMNQRDAHIFCYILPTWGLPFVIKPNAKNTEGDWGLCKGPGSYFWGGTWWGIYKNSKNKEMAWEFIKMMVLDRDTLRWWVKSTKEFIGNLSVIDEIKNGMSEPFLKGQNHYLFFANEASKVKGYLMGKYDLEIRDLLLKAVSDYVYGSRTKEEAIRNFENEIKRVHPDVIVE